MFHLANFPIETVLDSIKQCPLSRGQKIGFGGGSDGGGAEAVRWCVVGVR
jgi:hypothetical protein